jgi:hypothetical protein
MSIIEHCPTCPTIAAGSGAGWTHQAVRPLIIDYGDWQP